MHCRERPPDALKDYQGRAAIHVRTDPGHEVTSLIISENNVFTQPLSDDLLRQVLVGRRFNVCVGNIG